MSSTTDKPTAGVAAGLQIDWGVPIPMDDGVVVRADVFRSMAETASPVLLSYGPYGKHLSFQQGYSMQWARMVDACPDVFPGRER